MAEGPNSVKKRTPSTLNLALSQPDFTASTDDHIAETERSKSRIINKKDGISTNNSRYMLDQPIDSVHEKKPNETFVPLVMSVQEKIRLGIFLQSIGVPLTEMDTCNKFIQDKIHRAHEPGHISNLVSEKKLLISCIGLMNKRAATLAREIEAIRVQRVVRGYLERKRLADMHLIYADVDWKARNKTISEFLENENQYCFSLSCLVTKYLPQVSSIISKTETEKIFSNVVDLYEKHSMLSKELETSMDNFPHVMDIGLIWLKTATFLSLYGDYVFNISHAETTLRRLWDENSKFKSLIINIHRQLCNITHSPSLSLTSSLVTTSDSALSTMGHMRSNKKAEKESIAVESLEYMVRSLKLPQERIHYYYSILQEITKNTTPLHPDYTHLQVSLGTLQKLEEWIAKKITYSKQRNAILEIERRLQDFKDGDNGSDLSGCPRDYIREDIVQCHASFSQKGKQQKIVVILFSDLLLFAKPIGTEHTPDSKLKHLKSFPLLPSMRVESKHPKAVYQKGNYSVNLLDSKQELVCSFLCSTQAMQDLWINDLQRLLKELKLLHSTVYGCPILEMVKRVSNKFHPDMTQIVSKLSDEAIANVSAMCIPKFMVDIVRSIESRGLLTKGIYRVSADIENIDDIRGEIDSLKPVSDEFFQSFPVFALCDTFKLLFRSFPSPLLTFELYDPVLKIQCSYDESPEEYAMEIRKLFVTLPLINYAFLKFLACHLCKVEYAASENLMNTTNIAIVFGPTLLYPKEETMEAALRMSKVYSVVCSMIDYYQIVFNDKPPVKKNLQSLVIKTCPLSKSSAAFQPHSLRALLESSVNTIEESEVDTQSLLKALLESQNSLVEKSEAKSDQSTNSETNSETTRSESVDTKLETKLSSREPRKSSRRTSNNPVIEEDSTSTSAKIKTKQKSKDRMTKTISGGIIPCKDNKDKDKDDSPNKGKKELHFLKTSGSDMSIASVTQSSATSETSLPDKLEKDKPDDVKNQNESQEALQKKKKGRSTSEKKPVNDEDNKSDIQSSNTKKEDRQDKLSKRKSLLSSSKNLSG